MSSEYSTSDLERIDFGLGVAQQERHLHSYFYKSGAFQQACEENTSLILGGKGSGKSAIYQMLLAFADEIPIFMPPNLLVGDEQTRLAAHWITLTRAGFTSKVLLWKFYIASLVLNRLLDETLPTEMQKSFIRFLHRWGLISDTPTAWQALKRSKLSVGLKDFIRADLNFDTPLSISEVDTVIGEAQRWLESVGRDIWICMDGIDEAFIESGVTGELEELSSNLMRAVGDIRAFTRIRFKLFFRSDIYNALTYVNKDHFSSSKLILRWSKEDLAILLALRLATLRPEHSGIITYSVAISWIDDVFEWSGSHLSNFDNLYQKFKDGKGDVLPRDLVGFCIEAQRIQRTFNIQGVNKCVDNHLISPQAINQSVVSTAQSKLYDFLNVFKNFRNSIDYLRGSSTDLFTRQQLAQALNISDPLNAQTAIADLVRVGAIEIADKKSVNHSDKFRIPYLYALALEIGEPS